MRRINEDAAAQAVANGDGTTKRVVYASTNQISDANNLSANKRWAKSRGYNVTDANRVIDAWYNPDAYDGLLGRFKEGLDPDQVRVKNDAEIVYIPAPASGTGNIIPNLLAERLRQKYGGQIVDDLLKNNSTTQAKRNKTFIDKIDNPRDIILRKGAKTSVLAGKRIVIVDDVVTSGDTAMAIKSALGLPGEIPVVSLGAAAEYPPPPAKIVKFARDLYAGLTDPRHVE